MAFDVVAFKLMVGLPRFGGRWTLWVWKLPGGEELELPFTHLLVVHTSVAHLSGFQDSLRTPDIVSS